MTDGERTVWRGERAYIFRRGNILHNAWFVDGREYRESSGSSDLKVTLKKMQKRLRERAAHEETGRPFIGPEQKRVRVSELLDALEADAKLRGLRDFDKTKSHLRPVRAAFDDWRAVQVTPPAIDRYIEERLRQGRARATVNRETQLLGQAFRLAQQHGVLSLMPRIRRFSEKDNARQGFFEPADFEAVVEHLPDYLRDFARFAYLTGWRKGEITSLTWADVDKQGGTIRLRPEASKNREGRAVALEGELWAIVERRWKVRLVLSGNGATRLAETVFHHHAEPIGRFRKAWLSATKAAGLEGKLFHDLRRSAVRNMVRAGVPERVAMQISGHKTRSIFDRYNITSERDLREAVLKTQAYLDAAPRERTVLVFEPEQAEAR